jgi:two-component system LytT family response regulator
MAAARGPQAAISDLRSRIPLSSLTSLRLPLIALAWIAVAAVALAQRVIAGWLRGERIDPWRAMRYDAGLLALWALATPLILRSAARWPVRTSRLARHLAIHVALGSLFILATNFLIRIPLFLAPGGAGLGAMWRDTLLGVTTYYPPALIVYGVIVAIGHLTSAGDAAPAAAGPAAPPERDAAAAAMPDAPDATDGGEEPGSAGDGLTPERLVVREWNRVHLIRLGDIEWIEADDNYVVVHAGGRAYKGRERIGDVEARLDPKRFVRIHRSTIVPIARIREVQPLGHRDHAVILHGGKVLRVARTRLAALEAALGVGL